MIPDGYSELFMPTYSFTSNCPDTSGQNGEVHPLTHLLLDSLAYPYATHPDVVVGTTYAYAVKTVGPLGYISGFSDWADICVSPPPPEELVIQAVGNHIVLNWSEVSGIELYSVYRGTTLESMTYLGAAYGANPTTYTDSSAAESGNYFYYITARY